MILPLTGPLQSMGSQSSSGMSGGGGSSSGNPSEQPDTPEPSDSSSSSSQRRRRADRQQTDRQPSSEEDVDLAEVLAYLLRRWTIHLTINHYQYHILLLFSVLLSVWVSPPTVWLLIRWIVHQKIYSLFYFAVQWSSKLLKHRRKICSTQHYV